MLTELFWIDGPWPGRLAISSRPRGGDWLEDEIKAWRASGIDTIVSLLTTEEAESLGLNKEQELCEENRIEYYSLPITDRSVPTSELDTKQMIDDLDAALSQGKNINVHCRQGVGRSGLIASGLLIEGGLTPAQAIRQVSDARHIAVPETAEQLAWIRSFAARLAQKR